MPIHKASTAEDRWMRHMDANPADYDAHIRTRLGVAPADAEFLLKLHDKVQRGGKIADAETQRMQRIYPTAARAIPDLVDQLQRTVPERQRGTAYLAMLAGDTQFLQSGDYSNKTDDLRSLERLAQRYHTHTMVDAIAEKRDAASAKEDRGAGRTGEMLRHTPEPLDTRELIKRQLEPAGVREMVEAARGNPQVEYQVRNAVADRLQHNHAVLDADGEDASIRDAVAAAFDNHQIEAAATDEGWLPAPEDEL